MIAYSNVSVVCQKCGKRFDVGDEEKYCPYCAEFLAEIVLKALEDNARFRKLMIPYNVSGVIGIAVILLLGAVLVLHDIISSSSFIGLFLALMISCAIIFPLIERHNRRKVIAQ